MTEKLVNIKGSPPPRSKTLHPKYISGKRKTRENVGPLLNGAEALVTQDMNVFFTLVFTYKTDFQEYQVPQTREKV